jgi:protein phosphatase
VRGLLSDYYATPDTWAVNKSLDTVIKALNRWLVAHAARTREAAGMATTLSAIVLRGRRYYLAHVGDSRIYRLRGGRLEQLSTDHVWEHPELKNVLSRAVGLDAHLSADYADGELEAGDVFALMSDGVWGQLGDRKIADILQSKPTPGRRRPPRDGRRRRRQPGQLHRPGAARRRPARRHACATTSPACSHLPLPPRLKPGQHSTA